MSSSQCEGRIGSVQSWSAVDPGMRARGGVDESPANHGMSALRAKYRAVRSMTDSLMAGLSAEDQMVQSCADVGPLKCISSGRSGRIQRQIHVRSDDPPGRVVRHSGGSYSRNLPQLLSPATRWQFSGIRLAK
jgi:hypothetical protein